MYRYRKKAVCGMLAAAMIWNAAMTMPVHAATQPAEAEVSLDEFASQVRKLTANDDRAAYYHELVFDKATQQLSRDAEPVGDSCGEICVENGKLVFTDTAPLTRTMRKSARESFAAFAQSHGYTYEEDSAAITLKNEFQTARLIVKAKGDIPDYGAESVAEGYHDLHILQYASAAQAYLAFTRLTELDGVEYVQPSHVVNVDSVAETDENEAEPTIRPAGNYNTWGEPYLNTEEFIGKFLADEVLPEVIVAVIDTGINRSQSALAGRILADEVNYSDSGDDTAADDLGHGTHVTGTICELTPSNVKILPIKVFDQDGSGTDEQIYLGLMYAIAQGADVVNMSFGGLGVSALEVEAIEIAQEHGLTTVAAAGNNADDAAYYYPGGIEECITVAAVDQNLELASFSNRGSLIDVAAPGVGITSLTIGENDEKEMLNGTSMATPHVTACCALLKSYDKTLTPAKIQALIQANATDIGAAGFDKEFGWGMVSLHDFDWCEGICHAPTFSPKGGNYGNAVSLKITSPTENAEIYYTTDGSLPSKTNGKLYAEPIEIAESTLLQAICVMDGCIDSQISKAGYTLYGKDTANAFVTENGILTKYLGVMSRPVLPETDAAGNPLTTIGDGAFAGNPYITELTLPDTVTRIGKQSFAGCDAMEKLTSASVLQIGDEAFADCTALEELKFSPKLNEVGAGAFRGCCSVEELDFGTVTSILPQTCKGCESLETVHAPKAISLGDEAFAECKMLSVLTCDWKSVTEIGNAALQNCISLGGELDLRNIKKLGKAALSGDTALKSVLLSDAIIALEDDVFYGCAGLYCLSLPSVTKLGARSLALKKKAFNLTTDLCCSKITDVGTDAFMGFPIGDGFDAQSFDLLDKLDDRAFAGALAGELRFPNVKEIGGQVFAGATIRVASFTALNALASGAITGCEYLVLSDSCKSIADDAIAETTKIIVPAGVSLPEIYAERTKSKLTTVRTSGKTTTVTQYGYVELACLAGGIGTAYHWFSTDQNGSFVPIKDGNTYFFAPSTKNAGKFRYICVATDSLGNTVSNAFDVTVSEADASIFSSDVPIFIPDANLHSVTFHPAKDGTYYFDFAGDTRDFALITDADNHEIARTALTESQISVKLSAGDEYRVHYRSAWQGASQLSVSNEIHAATDLSKCEISFEDEYYLDDPAAFQPSVTVKSPDGKLLAVNKDYSIQMQFVHENGVLTLFGMGDYCGAMNLSVKVYPLAAVDTPMPVHLSDAKDTQTYVFIPKESGKYNFYATYSAAYKTDYEKYLKTGSSSGLRSYNVRAAADVYDSEENLLISNSFNSYTGSRFSAKLDMLAGQKYYFVCSSKSAAEYQLVISQTMRDMKKVTVEGMLFAQYANGMQYEPEVTVMNGDEQLVENRDYVVIHENNTVPGLAKVNVVGIGLYTGSVVKEYSILYDGRGHSDTRLELREPQQIDLMKQRITTAWFTAESLIKTEYKARYYMKFENAALRCSFYRYNSRTNSYSFVLTTDGRSQFLLDNGEYCLVFYSAFENVLLSANATIFRPYNLEIAEVTVEDAIYTGDNLIPELTVTVGGETLVRDEDFKLTYPENHAMFGEQEFYLSAKSEATAYGTQVLTYNVIVDLPEEAPFLEVGAHEAEATLEDRLVYYRICVPEDTDYLLASTDVMNTVVRVFDADANMLAQCYGTGTQCLRFTAEANKLYYVMVKFNGFNRQGTLHFELQNSFRILDECEKIVAPVFWTGEETTPDIQFVDGDYHLQEGVDYQLRYCVDEVNVGTATANFIGMGDYYGTSDVAYDIIMPTLFEMKNFRAYPICFDKHYTGTERPEDEDDETACPHLIYRYTSGLETELRVNVFNLQCRMTFQLYDENGKFLKSCEMKTDGELDFSSKAGETVYILLSATDINTHNQTFTMFISDISGKKFELVKDTENHAVYRICPALKYAELADLVTQVDEETLTQCTLQSEISGYQVKYFPEAVFSTLPMPYTVIGFDGCAAADYAGQYHYAYIDPSAAQAPEKTGDLNGDGQCTLSDGVLLFYLVSEIDTVPMTDAQRQKGDINGDGMLTILDYLMFIQLIDD